MKISRRTALLTGASFGALFLAGCDNTATSDETANQTKITADNTASGGEEITRTGDLMKPLGFEDNWLGDENAKVTIIEYASPTCPHCATFHNQVFPEFKKEFIDTGKVRFVMRPFSRSILDAVVFMVAACDEPAADYYKLTSAYFETMRSWAVSDNPKAQMAQVAINNGFTQETFEACLTNQELFKGLEKTRNQALEEFGLEATPTFYVNGKKLAGVISVEEFAKEIEPLL
ncbi:DsbA family protein [Maritalea porphyrae]|uniref:DsbA family protein n=1 Tax=Maritalea porphyrae TaxID=880732 RepID=UPI0022AE5A34|nr:DsbA family protein [Maritalea porphyrae]MCZ4271432.1 DsbA family protein [Maritalea porphyrae]